VRVLGLYVYPHACGLIAPYVVRRSDRQKWGLKEGQFPFHGHTSFKALLLANHNKKKTHLTHLTHFQMHSFLDKFTRAVSPGVLCLSLFVFLLFFLSDSFCVFCSPYCIA